MSDLGAYANNDGRSSGSTFPPLTEESPQKSFCKLPSKYAEGKRCPWRKHSS